MYYVVESNYVRELRAKILAMVAAEENISPDFLQKVDEHFIETLRQELAVGQQDN